MEMPDNSVAVFFAATKVLRSGDTPYPFCQEKSFYYLTGYDYPDAVLLALNTASKTRFVLFVRQLSKQEAHWQGSLPSIEDAKSLTGIDHCIPLQEFPAMLRNILLYAESLLIDCDPVPVTDYLSARHQFIERVRERHPHLNIVNARPVMTALRAEQQPDRN